MVAWNPREASFETECYQEILARVTTRIGGVMRENGPARACMYWRLWRLQRAITTVFRGRKRSKRKVLIRQFSLPELVVMLVRQHTDIVMGNDMFQICCDRERCGVNYSQRCLYGSFRYSV